MPVWEEVAVRLSEVESDPKRVDKIAIVLNRMSKTPQKKIEVTASPGPDGIHRSAPALLASRVPFADSSPPMTMIFPFRRFRPLVTAS